jgi:MFS family permease
MTVARATIETPDPVREGFVDRTAKSEYYRLALACFLVSFTSAHSTLLAVVFQRDGYDLHAIGLLLSSLAVPVIAVALVSGAIITRIGALAALRVAMTLTAAGFAMLLVTRTSFWPALMSRLVQGAGQGLYLAAAYTYIQSRLSPKRFLFLLGVFSATMPLSQAIAPPVGGAVLERFGANAFFIVGASSAVIGIALTFGLRALPPPPARGGLHLFDGLRPGAWEPLLAVLMNGTLFGFCTAYLAAAMVARGIPLSAFFTASLVTMFASRLLALRSIETIERRYLVGLGLTLMSVGFVAVAASGASIWPVIAGGIAFGFGYSLTYPVLSAWISQGVDPDLRAGPQAVLNAAFNFGLFAMPLPETWLVASLGYERAMMVLAAIGIVVAGVLVIRARRAASVHDGFT